MALKKCKECGRDVSTKAKKCPNCGAPVKRSSFVGCLLTIIGILIVIGMIGSLFDNKKSNTIPKSKTTAPKSHIGKNQPNMQVSVTGKVDELPKNDFRINKIEKTTYKMFRSKKLDRVDGTTRMQYDIKVPADTDDEEVRSVLTRALGELTRKREVDALVLFLHLEGTGEMPYAKAVWAPYGDWAKAQKGTPKSIFETEIEVYAERRPSKESCEKNGLSFEKRQQIYREICRSQKKTLQMAKEKYPKEECLDDIIKQSHYMRDLDNKYENQICNKYNITKDQKSSIMADGMMKNWPQ